MYIYLKLSINFLYFYIIEPWRKEEKEKHEKGNKGRKVIYIYSWSPTLRLIATSE